jgi:hypothetical protein
MTSADKAYIATKAGAAEGLLEHQVFRSQTRTPTSPETLETLLLEVRDTIRDIWKKVNSDVNA